MKLHPEDNCVFRFQIRLLRCFIAAGLLTSTAGTVACDLCGCYTPQLETLSNPGNGSSVGLPEAERFFAHGLYAAVAEQFTHFNTLLLDGREVGNPTDQHLESSITQLVAGYSVTSNFGLQLNIPLIYRAFERPKGFAVEDGTESGLGDISLLGNFVLFHKESGGRRTVSFEDAKSPRLEDSRPDFAVAIVLTGGVKFPTGGTSRLLEEFNERSIPGAPPSGIHGHDLTLGTGSFDGIFGGQSAVRYRDFFMEASVQFTLRGDGAHQYHFANDLTWSGGPGYYILRHPDAIVGLQCAFSGESKDVDRFRGAAAEDTGITSVFVGPRIVASYRNLSAEIGGELPVAIHNTALQLVPDFRIRSSISIHF
jgi:hypothetical protein